MVFRYGSVNRIAWKSYSRMELQGQSKDLRPELPLIIRW